MSLSVSSDRVAYAPHGPEERDDGLAQIAAARRDELALLLGELLQHQHVRRQHHCTEAAQEHDVSMNNQEKRCSASNTATLQNKASV